MQREPSFVAALLPPAFLRVFETRFFGAANASEKGRGLMLKNSNVNTAFPMTCHDVYETVWELESWAN